MPQSSLGARQRRTVHLRYLPAIMWMGVGVKQDNAALRVHDALHLARARSSEHIAYQTPQPKCDSCPLTIKLVATLGTATDSVLIHAFASIDRDSRGNYYVGQLFEKGRVGVYNSTGAFVRTIGRSGHGPGEFSNVNRVRVGPGDSLYTIDNANARVTVWNPAGQLIRSVPMHSEALDVVPQRTGTLVIRGPSAGYPLHLIGVGGEIRRSFGAVNPEPSIGAETVRDRIVAPAGPGLIWSMFRNQYRAELWDTTGKLIRSVVPAGAHWFTAWKTETNIPPNLQPRQPLVVGVRVSGNTLWILSTVAARNYKPRVPPPGEKERPALDAYFESPKYSEYVLEAVNVTSGKIVGSTRLTNLIVGGFLSFGTDDAIYSKRQRADGTVAVEVWRLSLGPIT